MRWSELFERIETAQKNWEIIKSDVGNEKEVRDFFKGSYLVLTNDFSQAGLLNFASEVQRGDIIKYRFLKDTGFNSEYARLSREVKECQNKIKGLFPGTAEYNKAKKPLDEAEKKLNAINLSQLEFADDITIEPRFPTMNMALIRKIKNHRLVDKDETDMSAANIRVVIKCK